MNAPSKSALRLGLLASVSFAALSFGSTGAHAACVVQGTMDPGNNPTAGQTVTCIDNLDNQGVNAPGADNVTVDVQAPSGGISVTGQPGVLLGNGATVTVAGPSRPISTSGDSAAAIDVQNDANISVTGVVSTSGENSAAIDAGDNATIDVTGGTVRTGGGQSSAITVGANSTVTTSGNSTVTTGNSNSDAVTLRGQGATLTVGTDGIVTTSSGMSNPVQVDGADGTVNVSGEVRSSSGDATAILATADGLTVNVRDGGFVTAQSSNSNAIESQGANATVTIENGGEVSISSGNSAAVLVGANSQVNVDGTITASSSQSQGVVLGDGSTLEVRSRGVIRTSSSESQAVLIDMNAATATVNVARGGNIDAVGAQAIVDRGMTETNVTVDGTVFGGSSEPVLDMGAGNDTVTVNGTVRATSADPVIDLGDGDDTLNNNSSQTIEGPGTLVAGGGGNDTLNLNNGSSNNSSRYSGFETTNVGRNMNTNDPANGMGSTLTVDNNQSGNTINAMDGGMVDVSNGQTTGDVTVNAMNGSSVNVTADNAQGTGTGQSGAGTTSGGAVVNTQSGSTVNVSGQSSDAGNQTATVSGANFGTGTTVATGRAFQQGTAAGSGLNFTSDFAAGAADQATADLGNALNSLAAQPNLTDAQRAALSQLISGTATGQQAVGISRARGEVAAQAAAAGIRATQGFTALLRPITSAARPDIAAAFDPTGSDARATNAFEADPANRMAMWVAGIAGTTDVDARAGRTAYDAEFGGFAFGVERGYGPDLTFGLASGYTRTRLDGAVGDGRVDAYSFGAYTAGSAGQLLGNVAVSYSYLDLDAAATSGGNGHVFNSRAEGVYDLVADEAIVFGPLGLLSATYASVDDVALLGGLGTLRDGDIGQFTAGLGLRFATTMETGLGSTSLKLDVLYEGELADEAINFSGAFGATGFNTSATLADEDRVRVGLEAGFAITDTTSLDLRYDGTFGSDVTTHTGLAKLSVKF